MHLPLQQIMPAGRQPLGVAPVALAARTMSCADLCRWAPLALAPPRRAPRVPHLPLSLRQRAVTPTATTATASSLHPFCPGPSARSLGPQRFWSPLQVYRQWVFYRQTSHPLLRHLCPLPAVEPTGTRPRLLRIHLQQTITIPPPHLPLMPQRALPPPSPPPISTHQQLRRTIA